MTQYEDTLAGSADISGDPPPSRPLNPKEIDAQRRRNVNRHQQGPQPEGRARAREGEAQQQGGQGEGKSDASNRQDPGLPAAGIAEHLHPQATGNPFTGTDPFANIKQDPEAAYWREADFVARAAAFFGVGRPDFSTGNHRSRQDAREAGRGRQP